MTQNKLVLPGTEKREEKMKRKRYYKRKEQRKALPRGQSDNQYRTECRKPTLSSEFPFTADLRLVL
jgi:hypothetical protein